MHVITIDYALDDKHITRCDEALFDGTNISRIENYIKIFYSPNQTQDKYAMQTSSAQMDMVIERADGIINLCEMKYTSGAYALTKEEAKKLQIIFRNCPAYSPKKV